ncbi:transposase [Corynebacterium macginleyi]|uniref:transposase n=1 Tax=Corynebacterium macginleyi TaxID=38290 RepID=UPI00190ABDD1|nr:transposase [Corynebacterium macginleyi]MBK4140429.1 transposase [Corynebacterium macginleyi]
MFIVSSSRKKYTPEYRREAANLVIESERPIVHVAKEIGVSAGLLGRWVKLERERRGASDGMSEADLRAENARLGQVPCSGVAVCAFGSVFSSVFEVRRLAGCGHHWRLLCGA